jgi:hypothetical protein
MLRDLKTAVLVALPLILTFPHAALAAKPTATVLCKAEGFNAQFLIQFGDERLPSGEVVASGVHNVVRGERFLADASVLQTKGLIGERETLKLVLKSGGSVELLVDSQGGMHVSISKSSAIFGDSLRTDDCQPIRLKN